MSFTYAVALTGSIGTGKSTAAVYLVKLGFSLIDADKIAHQILNEQHKEIAKLFGATLVKENKVDRKVLGTIVFADEKKRKALENLLHPLIFREIEKCAKRLDEKKVPYLVDIPLFFETNRYPIAKVLVVYTPASLQLQRLIERDCTSEEEAQKRINTQISIEEKGQKADYVIDNSGTLAHLERECKRVKDVILKDFT